MLNPVPFLRSRPFYFTLLPLFFVLHAYTAHFRFILLTDILWLLFIYTIASLVIFFVGWRLFKQSFKAAFFTFCAMSFNFFFGDVLDFLKAHFPDAFFTHYKFLLPFFLVAFLLLVWFLKKRNRPLRQLGFYLNVLFLILILIDAGLLLSRSMQQPSGFVNKDQYAFKCDSCNRPDIYFLVFDEYSSTKALKETWNYDNSDLDNYLANKGFRLFSQSRSNYNFTPFSIASTLNMDFLKIPNPSACTIEDYKKCLEKINSNRVCSVLNSMGYNIVNCSIFDLHNISSPVTDDFLPLKTKLITSQTFIGRIVNDLFFHLLVGKYEIKSLSSYLFRSTYRNNQELIRKTLKATASESKAPKFVYSHVEMPHFPFYFDREGKEKSTADLRKEDILSYIEYLPKTNEVIKEIVDSIFRNSHRPFVIVLMGDHGFREQQKMDFQFRNLNAVYLSSGNYTGFYDSITNVNEFSVLFNNLFHGSLALKKDSTVALYDAK